MELVWANTFFGIDTMYYHARFGVMPVNDVPLNVVRNKDKFKYVMMGTKLWNSFTLEFQVEIVGSNNEVMSTMAHCFEIFEKEE